MITETSVNSDVIMYLHMLIKHRRVFSAHSCKESLFIELIPNTTRVDQHPSQKAANYIKIARTLKISR